MPHTVESTIRFSAVDYARGAVDLTPEEIFLPSDNSSVVLNQTMLETAVSVVREAGPKVIEAIVSHLVPVHLPDVPVNVSVGSGDSPKLPEVPEVFSGPSLETIVIVTPSNYSLSPPTVLNQDTVSIYCV
jgi:hypothetical protein